MHDNKSSIPSEKEMVNPSRTNSPFNWNNFSFLGELLADFEIYLNDAREHIRLKTNEFMYDLKMGGALSRKASAKYLACGLTSLDSLVKNGQIKAVYINRHIRFRKETLEEFLKRHER